MRRAYTAFVSIFWLTTMATLFNKEVLPSLIIKNPAGYRIEVTKDLPMRETWMGIYFKDKKIGFSNTTIIQTVEDGVGGYSVKETSFLKLVMFGEETFLRIKGSSFITEDYILKKFDHEIISGTHKIEIKGQRKGPEISLRIFTGKERIQKILSVKNNALLSSSISPILLFKSLDADKELTFEVFDPVTMETSLVNIRKIGREALELDGTSYETIIYQLDAHGIKTKSWVTPDGDILKEESDLGFSMVKEASRDALEIREVELAREFSIASGVEILDPRGVTYLKIEQDGNILEIFKDREPALDKVLPIPIEEIAEEEFVQSKNKKIVEEARRIIGDEKNSWVCSKKISSWVYENIKKRPTLSIPSSLDVLQRREGDCNEHTVLFAALTRSLGIPTRMIAGLVYINGAFYYHAWPEVFVGEWIAMDPLLGQVIADATHIPLLEGGVKEQLELLKMVGNINIEVLEYRYDQNN